MRLTTWLVLLGLLSLGACSIELFDATPDEPITGPHGIQGIEGQIDGKTVELWSFAGGFSTVGLVWEESTPFSNVGWLLARGSGDVSEGHTDEVDLGLIHMPDDAPKASQWLCSGEGSEITVHEDGCREIVLRDLSSMGSCRNAPSGPYAATLVFRFDESSLTGSADLNLDGATVSGMTGGEAYDFEAETDRGRVVVWVRPSSEPRDGVDITIDEAALIVPDEDGSYRLACGGPDSTITREDIAEDQSHYRVKLVDVSFVGRCPGEPVSGRLLARHYRSLIDI